MDGIIGVDISFLAANWTDLSTSRYYSEVLCDEPTTYEGWQCVGRHGWVDFGSQHWCFDPDWEVEICGRTQDGGHWFVEEVWIEPPESELIGKKSKKK